MSSEKKSSTKRWLRNLRNSRKTKNFLVFLVFVCIASLFWVIMTLNEDVQKSVKVKLVIDQVPDSVTFITDPPSRLRLTVRDRGTNIVHHTFSGAPELHLNFEDFAEDGVFSVPSSRLNVLLRHLFGPSASISSVTPDSLHLAYTSLAPRRIPVEVVSDVTAAPGMVIEGHPKISSPLVELYGSAASDTLRRLFTQKIALRNLNHTSTVEVPIEVPAGCRAIPSSVKVTFQVESLVKKEADIVVEADNIPAGQDILFFPTRVRVSYYVPMSHYSDGADPIKIVASFSEAVMTTSDKVGLKVVSKAPYVTSVELLTDSVEYSLVRSN